MVLKEVLDNLTKEIEKISEVKKIVESARELFDNRLGWGTQQNPYAPRELWAELGASLYGDNDERVKELRLDQFEEDVKIDSEGNEYVRCKEHSSKD